VFARKDPNGKICETRFVRGKCNWKDADFGDRKRAVLQINFRDAQMKRQRPGSSVTDFDAHPGRFAARIVDPFQAKSPDRQGNGVSAPRSRRRPKKEEKKK
jgi:hypothetical protein